MKLGGMEIVCPRCRHALDQKVGSSTEELSCAACGAVWPIIAGIPDLRIFPDPYIDMRADREKAVKLAELLDQLGFRELVDHYYRTTSVVPDCDARRYTEGLLAAEDRARATLRTWEQMSGTADEGEHGTVLEIGCGTAPLLVTSARKHRQIVGVDIALRWLVVGKKRLAEAGIDAPLLCACAEALPFNADQFDCVMAESTIDHVADQAQVLRETTRVLRSGGLFFASTPNRLSLGPDPHISGVWAGGWWPKSWLAALVRRRGGIPPQRSLLTTRQLSRLARDAGLQPERFALPDLAPQQRRHVRGVLRIMVHAYDLMKRMPGGRQLLLMIGPLFHFVARRQPVDATLQSGQDTALNPDNVRRSQVVAS